MAKRTTKPKEKAVEPTWYTVGWSYTEPQQGGAVGGSFPVYVKGEAAAQAAVENYLRVRSITWKSITIVKGRDPGLTWTKAPDRYAAELQIMIGRLRVSAAAPDKPSPIWVHGDPSHDSDATARTMWAKFMDESSHGLSVSDFPRFVICDVDGYPTLPLPSKAVKDEKRWDGITAVVREQLDYWKATLQERIERLGKVKRRSAEDADQLKRDKATLKALEAFDGWDYQRYVEQLLPGRKPHSMDLDNRRLYRLSNGQLIPVTDLGTYVLRVDFWKRLLALGDGPMDKRADNVRAFLDYHHRNGGKPEQFRDLVKDTLPRLRKLTGRELLVDKLDGWLAISPKDKPKTTAKVVKAWPDLKTLALFHALRWATADKSADLPTDKEASEIATTAGHPGTDNGRRLRSYFITYRNEAGRTGIGKLSTAVLKRYAAAIAQLGPWPKALALAEEERELVRSRAHDRED